MVVAEVNGTLMLIDGRNQRAACKLVGVEPTGLVRQLPSLLGPAGIIDHVANCLELGIDPKQEPHDRAEGENRQAK